MGSPSKNLLLMVSACLLCLGVLECTARIARPSSIGNLGDYIEYDPQLGWRHRAGTHVTFKLPEFDVDMRINSRGLRGPEWPYEHPRGVFRILMIGDSYVEAFAVPERYGVVAALEKTLRERGCRVEVINGGVAGYATDQEYLWYRAEGFRYAPDLVIVSVFYNDITANADTATKPGFTITKSGLELTGVPATPPSPGQPRTEERSRSALYDWVRRRVRSGAPVAYNRLARIGLWQPIVVEPRTRSDFRVFEVKERPAIRYAWRLTSLLLNTFADEVGARGSRFVLLHSPGRLEVDDAAWQLTSVKYGWTPAAVARNAVADHLQRIAEELAVPLIDPSDALRDQTWSPYYREDIHWNARGNSVVAAEIAASLLRTNVMTCAVR